MRTALLLATGRPQVTQVIKAFVRNYCEYGHDPQTLSMYLAIDTVYQGVSEQEFVLDDDLRATIKAVTYLTHARREALAAELASRAGVRADILRSLLCVQGYSQQRNTALIAALLDDNDLAICVDDDEFPDVPSRNADGTLRWTSPDFFGPHQSALADSADLTRGLVLGYRSPIPTALDTVVPAHVLQDLGQALSYGSEVIAPETFLRLAHQIQYQNTESVAVSPRPFEVANGPGGKFLLTGNMGINLHSVRERRFPLFYTPPDARGEDAILSMQLADLKLVEVESFIFHDPFHFYPGLLQRIFPRTLVPIPLTRETIQRFCAALLGWLKYAPLYIKLSSATAAECRSRLELMQESIAQPTVQLAKVLNCPGFAEAFAVLQRYALAIEEHGDELQQLQRVWHEQLKPALFSEKVSSNCLKG